MGDLMSASDEPELSDEFMTAEIYALLDDGSETAEEDAWEDNVPQAEVSKH